jgi:hypothetical protein
MIAEDFEEIGIRLSFTCKIMKRISAEDTAMGFEYTDLQYNLA